MYANDDVACAGTFEAAVAIDYLRARVLLKPRLRMHWSHARRTFATKQSVANNSEVAVASAFVACAGTFLATHAEVLVACATLVVLLHLFLPHFVGSCFILWGV